MAEIPQLTSAKLMGAWIIDMADMAAAHTVIDDCRAQMPVVLEVRHTLWGVQVRTDSDSAAQYFASHYAPASADGIALAA